MTISLSGHRKVQILRFLVPAYGTAELNFKASLMAISPAEIIELNNFIKSVLPAGQKGAYDALKNSSQAGGLSFLGLWAKQTDPLQAMTKAGITEDMQDAIIKKLSKLAASRNEFSYQSSVDNSQSDSSTTGQLSVVTVNVHVPDQETGALVTRTIIAPDVIATAEPHENTKLPSIKTGPLYAVP